MQATPLGAVSTNLPLALTSFIGREREQVEVERLLGSARLLTLTGPPGCGKTRLALEAGRAAASRYPDGVWWVDLTQTADPAAVPRLAARALGLMIMGDTDVVKAVVDYIQPRLALLILDNCEHVLQSAGAMTLAILTACPGVQILTTSQAPLGVPGEQEWLVPSLPVPDAGEPLPDLEGLHAFAAVRLFEERAGAALPGFCVSDENAQAVVEICRRLDGIPLAIELAAARVKLFSVQEIEQRLEDRFALLAAPRRFVPSRHQTLRSAIDWSFNLLAEPEQALLCRLSVFTGSFSLEAAEAVCGYEPLSPGEVSRSLAELVDRSLVVVDRAAQPQTRCHLLDSIRQYGKDQFTKAGQDLLQDRHLDYYALLANRFDQKGEGPLHLEWLDRLEADWSNIRAAAIWVHAEPNNQRLLQGLQMVGKFVWFFYWRNHIQEPVAWLEWMLERALNTNDSEWLHARAQAHFALGLLHYTQLYASPIVLEQLDTSRALWKKLGQPGRRGYAYSTIWAIQLEHQNFAKAYEYLQECKEIFEAENDLMGTAFVMVQDAQLAERTGNLRIAEAKFRELLAYGDQLGHPFFTGMAKLNLSAIFARTGRREEALHYIPLGMEDIQKTGSQRLIIMSLSFVMERLLALGDLEQTEERIAQLEVLHERMGILFNRADILHARGEIHLLKGDFDAAESCFRRTARAFYQRNFWPGSYRGCLGLAAAAAEKDPALAARIYGFAQKIAGSLKETMMNDRAQAIVNERIRTARILLGETSFEQKTLAGAECSLDEVIPPVEASPPQRIMLPETYPRKLEKARYAGLTQREREIAARIARGLSNPAIAEELTISERTVTTHVTNILAKLGFSSRTQIAAWAAEKGLAATP